MDRKIHTDADYIFWPSYVERFEQIRNDDNFRFVHYTSAEAAVHIIRDGVVWLRNSQCMNDISEIEHGFECLKSVLNCEKEEDRKLKLFLDDLYPGLFEEVIDRFNGWLPTIRSETYILSISQHCPENEGEVGRLSMWRAYGGRNSVALVLRPRVFGCVSDAFKAYVRPVTYNAVQDYKNDFENLLSRMNEKIPVIEALGRAQVFTYLFDFFKSVVFNTKHKGFAEELEWRMAYNPCLDKSKYIDTSVVVIQGIPQMVCKIKLEDIPEEDIVGMSLPKLIDKVIIGPNEHQSVTKRAFVQLLVEAGCDDASERVVCSGIPLR